MKLWILRLSFFVFWEKVLNVLGVEKKFIMKMYIECMIVYIVKVIKYLIIKYVL